MARVETLRTLPSPTAVLDRLFTIINDKNASFSQLFDVVRYDQAIASKIIHLANSAYYSRGTDVVSLKRAMVLIGLDEIKNIVMCLIFLKEILSRWNLDQRDLALLLTHSFSVACVANILSRNTMTEDPEKVFTAAILHDIGKIVFFTYGGRYRQITEWALQRDICGLEVEHFGIDHQEVGCLMAIKWRFPEDFRAVIRGHHGGEDGELVRLVTCADRFVDDPEGDPGPEGVILRREKPRIDNEIRRISSFLGL